MHVLWPRAEAFGAFEPYNVGFQRSLKVANLPLTVTINTIGDLAKIYPTIAKLTGTNSSVVVEKFPGRCEWVRKYRATVWRVRDVHLCHN